MAYRKTAIVLANAEAKRNMIIAATLDLIAKHGIAGLTTDAIAERAGVASGLIYKYFPDKVEMVAAAVTKLLHRDVIVIREAGGLGKGIRAWALQVAASYPLMSAVGTTEVYRVGIKAELAKLIRAAGAETPTFLAGIAYGAVLEAARTMKPRDAQALSEALHRAMGVRLTA